LNAAIQPCADVKTLLCVTVPFSAENADEDAMYANTIPVPLDAVIRVQPDGAVIEEYDAECA
jgi:hypothetical protein